MELERWQQLEKIFQATIERPTDERAAFLDEVCRGDESLRDEAESLVASFEEASGFIEKPLLWNTQRLNTKRRTGKITRGRSLVTGDMPADWIAGLAVGRKIQHYDLLSLLGAGGMGEVYLAEDHKLHRLVALKLLPPHFTRRPEHVKRFEREARAASSLNHPNIITIHEIGHVEGTHFIATEFVEGETLRQRMSNGEMSLIEIIDITSQIAGALSAAHAAGIVHRDIKPENIMLRPDGLVKVLDFGLAKPLEREDAVDREGTPQSITLQTDPGSLMGTTSYLSPEQVRGDKVDHRTDIFSLGVVLYEMIAGRRPFTGGSIAALFDAILENEPPAIERELPDQLKQIIYRTLEKDCDARYRTAKELKIQLKKTESMMSEEISPSSRPRGAEAKAYMIMIVLSILAVMVSLLRFEPDAGGAQPATTGKFIAQTARQGLELFPGISPDGNRLIYASRAQGNWDIYMQSVRSSSSGNFPEPVNLTADSSSNNKQPAFSPDGQRIAFRSSRDGGGLFLMDANGKQVTKLTDSGYNPAWSHDGREIIFSQVDIEEVSSRTPSPGPLYAVDVVTEKIREITTGDAVQPSCSPHGHRIAYWAMHNGGQRDIWTVASIGGEPVQVTNDKANDWNPVWSPDSNHLYFVSDRNGQMNLWRVPIDERSGKTTGEPEPVMLPSDCIRHFSLSKDGRQMVYVQEVKRKNLYQVAFDPVTEKITNQMVSINPGSRLAQGPDISPDGEWLVFTNHGEKQEDLFAIRPDGKGLTQITNDIHKDRAPRWSPDGKKIIFYSDRSGKYEAWSINRDGSGLEQLTHTADEIGMIFYPTWSSDGLRIAYHKSGFSPYIIETGKSWNEQMSVQLPGLDPSTLQFVAWDWSSDSKRLAGGRGSVELPGAGIAVYSFEAHQFDTVTGFGSRPVWLNDDRRLLFYSNGDIYLVDSLTKRTRKILSVAPGDIDGFTLSPDNRAIYFSLNSSEADVWLRSVE